jgi:pyruvate-ferredoxin/flavodoxin oxidoreductase
MSKGLEEQKKAVTCGHWPLYRFDPRLKEAGKNPLQLDSKAPTTDLEEFVNGENRFRILQKAKPEVAAALLEQGKKEIASKFSLMEKLSEL